MGLVGGEGKGGKQRLLMMELSLIGLKILCLSLSTTNIFGLNHQRCRFTGLKKECLLWLRQKSADIRSEQQTNLAFLLPGRKFARTNAGCLPLTIFILLNLLLHPLLPPSLFLLRLPPPLSSNLLSSSSLLLPPSLLLLSSSVYMCNRPHPNKATHESKLFEVCPRSHLWA